MKDVEYSDEDSNDSYTSISTIKSLHDLIKNGPTTPVIFKKSPGT